MSIKDFKNFSTSLKESKEEEEKERIEKNEIVACQVRNGAREVINNLIRNYRLQIETPWNKKMFLEFSRFDNDPENIENLSYMPANLLIPSEKILKRYRIFEDGESVLRKLFTKEYYKKSEIESVIEAFKKYKKDIKDIRDGKLLKFKSSSKLKNTLDRIGFRVVGLKDPLSKDGHQYFEITELNEDKEEPEKYITYVPSDKYDPKSPNDNVERGTIEEVLAKLNFELKPEQVKAYAKTYSNYFSFDKELKSGEIAQYRSSTAVNYIINAIRFSIRSEYSMYGAYFDITDIDLDEDPAYLTFIPARRHKAADKEKYRQRTRVGRVLRKLNSFLTEKDIEDFSNKFRAEIEEMKKPVNIEIVRGKDISYWYLNTRYESGGGSLNSSCMCGSGSQYLIKDVYDRFPDKIGLAIMKNSKGDKIVGRALVWNLDDGRVYMDRVYTVRYPDELKFIKFAHQNGMIVRSEGVSGKIQVTLSPIKKGEKLNFPYLDTFYYKDYKETSVVLSNNRDEY